MATTIRLIDIIKEAARILRDELKKTNFEIDDKCCDVHDLMDSWINGSIKPNAEYFLAKLLQLNRVSQFSQETDFDISSIEYMLDTDDEFTEVFDGEIHDVGNTIKSNIGAYSRF